MDFSMANLFVFSLKPETNFDFNCSIGQDAQRNWPYWSKSWFVMQEVPVMNVSHFNIDWEDIPSTTSEFLKIYKSAVEAQTSNAGPMVIHCRWVSIYYIIALQGL